VTEFTHPFARPVFILGAPRSCSTLLFQTLAQAEALYSLGDESHAVFEGHRKLSPGHGAVDSNRFDAALLDPALARSIIGRFAARVHDRAGRPLPADAHGVRLLEKTPKNALRVPFLDALFPDALFIYLLRDPRQNIGSIIDAWRAGGFVTYPRIGTAHGPWSLLLPEGWREYTRRPLEDIAVFQWCAANRCIIEDLAGLPRERWTALNATELLADPLAAVSRLCGFIGIDIDPELRAVLQQPLPYSRYTVSAPEADKWQRHAARLAGVWAGVAELVPRINAFVAGVAEPLSLEGPLPPSETGPLPADVSTPPVIAAGGVSRNQPCPCGSGKRFKACHGNLGA
jgi:hypothetical protein